MSSVRFSVSGQRALTTTLNDPQATHAQSPTKNDDKATVEIGNAHEISFMLPVKSKLELVAAKDKDTGELGPTKYLRVTIPGPSAHLSVFVDAPPVDEEGRVTAGGSWPHFTMNLGKHLTNWYAGDDRYGVVKELYAEIGLLIPPTDD